MSDPLADFLTRIRNAGMVRYETVDVPMDSKQGILRIELKYGPNGELVISGIRRVSKPGLRQYVKADDIPKVLSGLGISILSTSKGVMTDREARRLRIGGEILCEAW
jgi:small subunit ribosomal protein S8